jgi:hypothetical protein
VFEGREQMSKKVKLILEDCRWVNSAASAFKIKKVANSIEYHIDSHLSESEVGDIIQNTATVVEIIRKESWD